MLTAFLRPVERTTEVTISDHKISVYFIADYHALTEEWDPVALRTRSLQMALDLLACGIDPERSLFFLQSDVPEHAELTWIFNCLTSFGDLERMTQFKDRKERFEQTESFLSVGLFDYPVLQSADVLIYQATKVPVGKINFSSSNFVEGSLDASTRVLLLTLLNRRQS